jgi:hypothetical protein
MNRKKTKRKRNPAKMEEKKERLGRCKVRGKEKVEAASSVSFFLTSISLSHRVSALSSPLFFSTPQNPGYKYWSAKTSREAKIISGVK